MTGNAASALAQLQENTDPENNEAPELSGQEAENEQAPAPEVNIDVTDEQEIDNDESLEFSRTYESYGDDLDYEDYDDNWKPPGLLDAPDQPRPGFVERWVATTQDGKPDTTNLSKRYNEGWRPRDPATCPHGIKPPTISHGQFEGCIGVEGMVLMERPKRLHQKFASEINSRTEGQSASVRDNLFSVRRPGDAGSGFHQPEVSSERQVSKSVRPASDDD